MAIWQTQRTLLIVGEGHTEEAFLLHVKRLYAPRGCGLGVTIKNARGKSANHVVEWTIRQIANAQYDTVAVMFDTDVGWTPAVAKLAAKKKIVLLKSDSCFEELMLRSLGLTPNGDSKALKKQFAPYVNGDALQIGNCAKHFGSAHLEDCRLQEPTIDALLKLLGKQYDLSVIS
jgi:hypothetical protein